MRKGGSKRKRCGHQKGFCVHITEIISSWASWHQLVHEDGFCPGAELACNDIQTENVSSQYHLIIFFLGSFRSHIRRSRITAGECGGSQAPSLGTMLQILSSTDFFKFCFSSPKQIINFITKLELYMYIKNLTPPDRSGKVREGKSILILFSTAPGRPKSPSLLQSAAPCSWPEHNNDGLTHSKISLNCGTETRIPSLVLLFK